MNGEWVGTWTVDRATHSFVYDASWLRSPKVRSLSLSLPITGSELGLPAAPTTTATLGDQTVLVAERFDRAVMDDGAWIARLPQEDFCQALGFSPKQKYEQDGGPGMAKCLRVLTGSADPQQDTLAFQLTQLAFWLMAATDGHAKNCSIFLQPGETYVMTPLYDILSMWPYFGKGPNQYNCRQAGLAMAMRSKVLGRHLEGHDG